MTCKGGGGGARREKGGTGPGHETIANYLL